MVPEIFRQYKLRLIQALFLAFLFCTSGYTQTYHGTIIHVADGDTFTFQTAEGSFRVRSFGIDAPEGTQPFGKESKEFLSKYLNKKAVLKVNGTDRYHRKVGTLYINGKDINLLCVKGGYAWHYKRYLSSQKYAAAQESAKKKKLGLWALPNPVQPWNWRQVEKDRGKSHQR